MGMRYKPVSLNSRQLGQMNEEELFMDQLNNELGNAPDYEQPPITAQPMTDEEMSQYDGVQLSPNIPTPPPAIETPQPQLDEQPARPSSQPGTTAAVSAITEDELPSTKPKSEPDEYEKLFSDYGKARQQYERDISKFEKESAEGESKSQLMTGIAGALQAFGEGLAAITGGSAKPVQTGAATLRSIGEQQAAVRERKGKTLKERLQMAKEPLETKAEEIKFRDVFEKRQKAKRLEDPASPESIQARELANNFLDAYTASVSNRVDDTQLAKIEAIRPRLEKLNATQIKDFMDNLNKLKFTESKAEIEATKAEGKKLEATTKREQKLQDVADKEFSTDSKKLAETVDGLKRFQQRIGTFQNDVKLALGGDKEAAKRVVQNQGAVSYLIARQDEPKGVFTEQDYAVLNRLGSGLTWSQQLQNWMSKGFRAEYAPDALQNLDEVLTQLEFTKQDPSQLVKNYKTIYELSDNPFKKEYANRFDKVISVEPKPVAPSVPQSQGSKPNYEFKDSNDFQKAIPTTKFKPGDVIKIGNEYRKVQPNGKAVRIQGP